ncbi:MAG: ABC transporter permease [Clostridiales bacterium]|jgi:peptide/nickel transport system permease protein|nr:ABC transporter permease [Clostridiales bacterium]
MKLPAFILKRALMGVIVLVGLSVAVFAIARIVPGDPARLALGATASDAALETFRQENHLHEALPVQYAYWIGGVLHGDFGVSTGTKRPVAQDIREFLPATLEMALIAALMLVAFSIAVGSLAARKRDTAIDGAIRIISYVGVAMPGFVVATMLVLLFGNVWKVIPVLYRLDPGMAPPRTLTGFYGIDALARGQLAVFANSILHLLAPALALCLAGLCQEARLVRSTMIENDSRDFMAAMRGYGVPERVLHDKYLLKLSLIPAVSCMGMDVASLMSNAFLIEVIFGWPGISRYGMTAMLAKDLNAISGVIMVFGAMFVIVNIIVDVVVAWLDPRIRLEG